MPIHHDFSGRVALVTGVARVGQIGHAVAEALARAGARVVIADRNAVAVAERAREFTAQGLEVRPAAGDLTEPDVAALAVETAVRHFGGLDVLVNVAGGLSTYGPFAEVDVAGFERELSVNLKTAMLMSHAALAPLTRARGCIVNFSSIAVLQPARGLVAYSAAKAGVAALTRSLALELQPAAVRVNAVAPAAVRTRENVAAMGADARFVEMSDVINAVLFLASDASGAITGHVLPVTGGA